MFTVAILQQATVKPPNFIANEKASKFHAQPQTGAYSCLALFVMGPSTLQLLKFLAFIIYYDSFYHLGHPYLHQECSTQLSECLLYSPA